MNELDFAFKGTPVRVVMRDGEPWWVLKDVCGALGLLDTSRVAERLEEDELTRARIVSGGQERELYIINEPGLYSVILRSDKPEALAFRRWVTHEVIPWVRKHGMSNRAQVQLPDFTNPVVAARAWADQVEARAKLEAQAKIDAPKALVFDRISEAEGLRLLSEVGKINGIGPRKIFEILAVKKLIFRRHGSWEPMQEYIDKGYFVLRERIGWTDTEGKDHVEKQLYVTPSGECWIARKLFEKPAA
jgi:anti-repressor protein